MKQYVTPQMEVLRFLLPRLLEDSQSYGTIPVFHGASPIEANQGLAKEFEEIAWYEEEFFLSSNKKSL